MSDLHAGEGLRYHVSRLCGLFGVTKQAYYKRGDESRHRRLAEGRIALEYVREVRGKDPGIGGRKLYHMYSREFGDGCRIGRDAFETLIAENGLKLRRKSRRPRTTDSRHSLPTFPDLTRDLVPSAPNELWVSDITYVRTWNPADGHGFCYLSLVTDAYTGEIKGWAVGGTLATAYPLSALETALGRLARCGGGRRLIHHSDRGVQYASAEYINALRRHGVAISMTAKGSPGDNARAERMNGIVKNELLRDMAFRNAEEVRTAMETAVRFYNNERPHMSINMLTPAEAASMSGEIPKRWRDRRDGAVRNKTRASDIPEKSLPLRPSRASLRGTPQRQPLAGI